MQEGSGSESSHPSQATTLVMGETPKGVSGGAQEAQELTGGEAVKSEGDSPKPTDSVEDTDLSGIKSGREYPERKSPSTEKHEEKISENKESQNEKNENEKKENDQPPQKARLKSKREKPVAKPQGKLGAKPKSKAKSKASGKQMSETVIFNNKGPKRKVDKKGRDKATEKPAKRRVPEAGI